MSFWLPFLFSILGFLAIVMPLYTFSAGGSKMLFSDVIIFNEGVGSFTVVFGVWIIYDCGAGIILAVLHFDRYLGFGKF